MTVLLPPEVQAQLAARRAAARKLSRGHALSDDEMRLLMPDMVLPVDEGAPKEFGRCESRRPSDRHFRCVHAEAHPPPHNDGMGGVW